LPTPPTGEQNQKKRTFDVLPKPDKFIRYRHLDRRSCRQHDMTNSDSDM